MYPPPLLIETTIQGTGCVNCARPDLWGVSSSQAIDWTALSRKVQNHCDELQRSEESKNKPE
ncbi:MAG: hypothetical protein WC378_12985, partial [Opitutaceae bacterium]